jgi:8-oxo-dGTP pyrophosphatase MutT (NUDIX family)
MTHLNYYLDLCADAYIVNGDAVLLRLHEKYNMWLSPGGHVDPGEDLNEAVLREVWEEVGLRVELVGPVGWMKSDTNEYHDLTPPVFINRHKINDTHDHSSVVFIARSSTRDINPQMEADKGVECRWVTQEQLDELHRTDPRLRPEVYRYASAALKLVGEY